MVFIRANSKCPSVLTLITGSRIKRWIWKRRRVRRVLKSWLLWLLAKQITFPSNLVHSVLAIGHPALPISPQLWLSSFSWLLPSKIKDFWSDTLMLKWLFHFPYSFSFSLSSFCLLLFPPPFVPQSLLSNSYSPQGVISPLILYLNVRTIYPKPCADFDQMWFYSVRSSEERKISFHRSRKG